MTVLCFHSSRPLITASGRDGVKSEYELASEFYQILNRKAADGSAYITVSSRAPLTVLSFSWHAHERHVIGYWLAVGSGGR